MSENDCNKDPTFWEKLGLTILTIICFMLGLGVLGMIAGVVLGVLGLLAAVIGTFLAMLLQWLFLFWMLWLYLRLLWNRIHNIWPEIIPAFPF